MDTCKICNKECNSLARHLKMHNITCNEYYDKYLKTENEGKCIICGKQTRFVSLTKGYPHLYCSNKCHAQDPNVKAKHSYILRNKTANEKELIREKQINTWTSTMGNDWKNIMYKRSTDSFKANNQKYNTPFSDPDVRAKAETTWGASSPSTKVSVKKKISQSIKKYMDDIGINKFNNETLLKYKDQNNNIVDYKTDKFSYFCNNCKQIYDLPKLYVYRRLKNETDLCPKCAIKRTESLVEKELSDYIKDIYNGEVIVHDKVQLNGKELDVYLPEINVAFEFDGTYWHADKRFYEPTDMIKDRTAQEIWERDKVKDEMCESCGIILMRVKEFDWKNSCINIKSLIRNLINEVKKC